MRYLLGVLLISIMMTGCTKTPATKQAAGVNKDILSVQEADNALGQATLNAAASATVSPSGANEPASNMVVNNDAGPLVDQTTAAASAAKTGSAGSATGVAGDKPDDLSIQKALKNLGLYDGEIDGVIGPKTKEAIRAFQ